MEVIHIVHFVNCFVTGVVAGRLFGEGRWLLVVVVFVSPHIYTASLVLG